MQITPTGHILHSFAHRGGMSWRKALFEWLDNSLAAGATTIHIEICKQFLSISDNGRGTEAMQAFATLGEHIDHPKPDGISCYGVGCKDAALWIGKENSTMQVKSVHNGIARTVVVNWQDASRRNWDIDDPQARPAESGECGTQILVKPVGAGIPGKPALERILDDIGYYYAPALKQGVQITVKASGFGKQPRPAVRWEPPPLEPGHVDTTVVVGGKKARVFVGVIKAGHSTPRRGFTYFRKFRVIEPAGAHGCGNYNYAHVCGFVELDQSWRLTTNKEAIVNAADLYAAVEQASLEVLKRADERGNVLASKHLTSAIEASLNAGIANAKARRKKGKSKGRKNPTGTGKPHSRAENEQSGDTFPSGRGAALKVAFAPMGAGQKATIGDFKSPTVSLNNEHPLIAALLANNTDPRLFGLIAGSLVAVDAAVGKQMVLKGLDDIDDSNVIEKFQRFLGAILASDTTTVDGASLKAMPTAAE